MILPAQMIRKLCIDGWRVPPNEAEQELIRISNGNSFYTSEVRKLVHPFVERGEFEGKTYGLGPCTYDFRLDQILTEANDLVTEHTLEPGEPCLASSIECVAFPYYLCGTILDKSSWARKFVSAFNTHFDPGFIGYPTIELVNLSRQPVTLRHGMPIIQMKFEQLVAPTDIPYKGKYNHQPAWPVKAKEGAGAWGARLPADEKPAIASDT